MRGSHFMNLLAKKTSFFGGTESKWLEANNSNAADIPELGASQSCKNINNHKAH